MQALHKSMDLHSSTYENFIFLMILMQTWGIPLRNSYNSYSLTSLLTKRACGKNPSKPSFTDLILTNWPKYFQNSNIIKTGLSDFHKMVVTTMKITFRKVKAKITCFYRKYKKFCNYTFRDTILEELSQVQISNNDDWFNHFLIICRNTLDKLASRKKRYIRGNNIRVNHTPFMKKTLSKEIIKWLYLKNKYLKSRSEEHQQRWRKQINFLVSQSIKT